MTGYNKAIYGLLGGLVTLLGTWVVIPDALSSDAFIAAAAAVITTLIGVIGGPANTPKQ
jgi:hypothetical protein